MRIACLANSNNNYFTLVRYLRDRGHDAHLYLMNEASHFQPHCDTYDLSYQEYTHQLNWQFGKFSDQEAYAKQVKKEIEGYDLVFASEWTTAFLAKAGIRPDFYVPLGVDLYANPFYEEQAQSRALRTAIAINKVLGRYQEQINWDKEIAESQWQGINTARCVWTSNQTFIDLIDEKFTFEGHFLKKPFPILYNGVYSPETIEEHYTQSHWYQEFKAFRDKHEVVLFAHSRHIWCSKVNPLQYKANDHYIRGVAKAVHEGGMDIGIISLDYGPDVGHSKALLEELGIADRVKWFPTMPRKEIMIGISLSDIVVAEFKIGWFTGGTYFEALCMGKPLLHYRKDEDYQGRFETTYPLMNARTPNEITNALLAYQKDPAAHAQMGLEGKAWFEKYVVNDGLNTLSGLIDQVYQEKQEAKASVQ